MKKKWHMLQPDMHAVRQISDQLNIHSVVATLLVNRKITTAAAADKFLNPSMKQIRAPFAIKDMERATARIARAVRDHERILIFGDYDVDGVTATAGLLQFFKQIGAEATHYIPHRIEEGYGLKRQHINDGAVINGINLIITADCGSSSHDAARAAKEAGVDLIITDHHEISSDLPDACAVINPNRHDCSAGFRHLSGVGVAFCVMICLRKHLRDSGFWKNNSEPNLAHFCDLVALGTVADMVPMIDENRVFSKIGLDIMKSGRRTGIRALCEASGTDHTTINAEDIAFRIAPRLNAAGRVDHADIAVTLLGATDLNAASHAAATLNDLNHQRRRIEKETLLQVNAYLKKHPHITEQRAIVVSKEGWHEGVLGIVASRLVERYGRPTVIISIKNGTGKGSARGIPGINLYDMLRECKDVLDQFGGHAMAGGIQIQAGKIDLFRGRLNEAIAGISDKHEFVQQWFIDCPLEFKQISPAFMDSIDCLNPHGSDNPPPRFVAKDVRVVDSAIVGKTHRRMTLEQPATAPSERFKAIQFNVNPESMQADRFKQMAFRPTWNCWNGRKSIQLIVEDAITD